jgi:FkbM family methyltransferase
VSDCRQVLRTKIRGELLLGRKEPSFAEPEHELFLQLAKIGRAPKVVYDIGASNGWWSAIVSNGMPQATYHLFEPLWDHPAYGEILAEHMRKNRTWTLHKIALADAEGTATMQVDDAATGSTILEIGVERVGFDSKSDIPQHRLDDYAAKHNLPLPNAVKIDTQGGERVIMVGGKNTISAADVLMVETWLYRGYGPSTPLLGDIVDLATEMGFIAIDYGGHYRGQNGQLQTIDIFFAKPETAKALAAVPTESPAPASG